MLGAFFLESGGSGGGFGAGKSGLGAVEGRLIGSGIYLVERLAFPDVTAFGEALF